MGQINVRHKKKTKHQKKIWKTLYKIFIPTSGKKNQNPKHMRTPKSKIVTVQNSDTIIPIIREPLSNDPVAEGTASSPSCHFAGAFATSLSRCELFPTTQIRFYARNGLPGHGWHLTDAQSQ